jgi:hypothetical protein
MRGRYKYEAPSFLPPDLTTTEMLFRVVFSVLTLASAVVAVRQFVCDIFDNAHDF